MLKLPNTIIFSRILVKFLQHFPLQRKALFNSLGMVDSHPSIVSRFETHEVHPQLPYHLDFLVHVECMNNMIKCIVVDEDTVASMMSLSCWKGLSSPTLSKYRTMLTTFHGRYFSSHGIIPCL